MVSLGVATVPWLNKSAPAPPYTVIAVANAAPIAVPPAAVKVSAPSPKYTMWAVDAAEGDVLERVVVQFTPLEP